MYVVHHKYLANASWFPSVLEKSSYPVRIHGAIYIYQAISSRSLQTKASVTQMQLFFN